MNMHIQRKFKDRGKIIIQEIKSTIQLNILILVVAMVEAKEEEETVEINNILIDLKILLTTIINY
jgi:hypothetical protein